MRYLSHTNPVRVAHSRGYISGDVADWLVEQHVSRSYHNLQHLQEMWEDYLSARECFTFGLSQQEENALLLAICFHDCVYSPTAPAGQNEDDSAKAFSSLVALANPEMKESAEAAIRATAEHLTWKVSWRPTATDRIMDLDLRSMASSYSDFLESEGRISSEYSPHFSATEFIAGRREFLSKLVAKERVMHFTAHDTQLRANVCRWLEDTARSMN